MMWGYYQGMQGMEWWMVLSTLFWLGLVAVAVWALVRLATRAAGKGGTTPLSAEEILRQRFARGEIDGDTFERMRGQLDTTRTTPAGRG